MAEVIAYSSGNDHIGRRSAHSADIYPAQTFTPESTFDLTSISLLLGRRGTYTGTCSIGFYTTDGSGHPDSFLGSVGFGGSTLTADTWGQTQYQSSTPTSITSSYLQTNYTSNDELNGCTLAVLDSTNYYGLALVTDYVASTGTAHFSGGLDTGNSPQTGTNYFYFTDDGPLATDWKEVNKTGLTFTAGVKYAIVFSGGGAGNTTFPYWGLDSGGGYGGGNQLISLDGMSTWSDLSGDFLFKIYGDVTPPIANSLQLGSAGSFIVAGTDEGVYLSTDFGDTWVRKLPDSVADTNWNKGICSSDGTYIIVVSDADAIYRSANSGSSWAAITPAGGDTFSVNKMATSDDGQYMVIVGQNSTDATESCYISTDYGATWTAKKPVAASVAWTDCDISNDGATIGVSTTSYFYISLDSGSTWLTQGLAATAEYWSGFSLSGDGNTGLVANTNDDDEFFIGVKTTLYSELTWAETAITSAARGLLDDTTQGAQQTTLGLGTGDSPTFTGLTLSSIAAEGTDVDKFLVDSTGVIKYRTGTQVLSDIGASSTSHLHDAATLQHDAVNSDGGAFSFTTTGDVTFNQGLILSGTVAIGLDMSGGTFATAVQKWPAGTISTTGTTVFQPTADSTTAYQWLDADGGTPVLNIDSTNERVGIGTNAPDSIFHIKANFPGVVGSDYAGQIIIQNPANSVFSNAVITGYESDGDGNPDQQLWYLGSSSVGNSDITFLNRRNSKLQLGTNGVSQLTILGNGNVGIGEIAPETLIEWTSTVPYLTLHNSTEEDGDGGRESRLIFKGEQTGSEETTLFQFEASHDGAADDQLGKGIWSVNTGAGLTQALEIGSDLLATFAGSIVSANYTASNLLTACATNAGNLDFTAVSKTLSVDETETVSNYHIDSRAATWLAANHETTYTHADIASNTTHRGLSSGNPHSVTPTELSLVIGTNTQAWDAGLDSLAGLGYVSDSMIKITAEDTYAIRTMAEVRTDLGLVIGTNVQAFDAELTSLAALSYVAASFIKMTGVNTFALRTIGETADDLEGTIDHNLTANYDANKHVNHTGVTLTAGTGLTGGGDISANRTFAVDGLLEDLDTLGANSADSEFLVGTGAGALAWESGATARTSLGFGTGDSPTLAGLTLTNAAVIGSNSVVFQPNADSITFLQVLDADGGTPILNVDTTNERVGIGTTGPAAMLHLATGNDKGILWTYNAAGQYPHYIKNAFSGAVGGASMRFNVGTGVASSIEVMRLVSNGNVGIGITAPEERLHIAKSVLEEGCHFTLDSYNDDGSYYGSSIVLRKSHTDTLGGIVATIDGETLGSFGFKGVTTEPVWHYGAIIDVVQDGAAGVRIPCTMRLTTYSNTTQNIGIMIDSGGNFGVNTLSPDAQLQVVGNCKFGDDNTNYLTIGTTGDAVFVGTAGLVYGEISVKDNAVATTLNSGADVQLTVFDTNGPSNNTAPDQANNEITITTAGHYLVTVSIHVNNNAAQTHVIDVSVNKNNGLRVELVNVHSHRTLTGGSGDVGSMSMSGIVDLAVDDELQIWATTDIAADRSVTFSDITLSIIQIGGT